MALHSSLFKDDPALEACLIRDSAHLTIGVTGNTSPRFDKRFSHSMTPASTTANWQRRFMVLRPAAVLNYRRLSAILLN